MKIATIIARVLLGLVFVVFGLNYFFHVIPMPVPTGQPAAAVAFSGALASSGYMNAIKCFEIAGGALLLVGRKVPLGLTLVGPVLVNILLYDLFLDRSGLPMGIVMGLLALFLVFAHRKAFAGLLKE